MTKDPFERFRHALESIELIERYVSGADQTDFSESVDLQDKVIRRLSVIGEALSSIPPDIRDRYSEIRWKSAVGMRNFLIHEYFDVSLLEVWKTATEDLPVLKKQIQNILDEKEKEGL